MNCVLEVKDLHVKIKKNSILNGISFELKPKSIVGFLGPNGAGKSTTIKAIAGVIPVHSGKISCENIGIDKDYVEYFKRIYVGFDMQSFYPYLSGYENIMQYARITGTKSKEEISNIIEMVGLKNRINDMVKSYSLGMCQRLSIARALVSDAKVLLFDEPFNGIDPEGLMDIRRIFFLLRDQYKCSILISSHLLSEIDNLVDQMLFIKDGKIVDIVNIEEMDLVNHYITTEEADEVIKLLKQENIDANRIKQDIVKVKGDGNLLTKCIEIFKKHDIQYSYIQSKRSIEELYLSKVGGNEIV